MQLRSYCVQALAYWQTGETRSLQKQCTKQDIELVEGLYGDLSTWVEKQDLTPGSVPFGATWNGLDEYNVPYSGAWKYNYPLNVRPLNDERLSYLHRDVDEERRIESREVNCSLTRTDLLALEKKSLSHFSKKRAELSEERASRWKAKQIECTWDDILRAQESYGELVTFKRGKASSGEIRYHEPLVVKTTRLTLDSSIISPKVYCHVGKEHRNRLEREAEERAMQGEKTPYGEYRDKHQEADVTENSSSAGPWYYFPSKLQGLIDGLFSSLTQKSQAARKRSVNRFLLSFQSYTTKSNFEGANRADKYVSAANLAQGIISVVQAHKRNREHGSNSRPVVSVGAQAFVALVHGSDADYFNAGCFESRLLDHLDDYDRRVAKGAECIHIQSQSDDHSWTIALGADFAAVKEAGCIDFSVTKAKLSNC